MFIKVEKCSLHKNYTLINSKYIYYTKNNPIRFSKDDVLECKVIYVGKNRYITNVRSREYHKIPLDSFTNEEFQKYIQKEREKEELELTIHEMGLG